MHLLLTDRLTCPRCGPAFGLILLASRVEERRVLEGELGCPNCRDRYPVRGGFGDLRPPPRRALDDEARPPPEPPPAEAVRGLAVALGLGEGAGTTLLVGGAVRFAQALAELLPDVEVAALAPETLGWPERPGVSRLVAGPSLPFFGGMIRGVALGARDLDRAPEAARVVARLHRVVVLDPPEPSHAVASVLQQAGLSTVVEGPGMLVSGR